MPRKKREVRSDYRTAGFHERQGKGDHTVFWHPLVANHYSVDGKEGADAKPYDERNLQAAIKLLAIVQRSQRP